MTSCSFLGQAAVLALAFALMLAGGPAHATTQWSSTEQARLARGEAVARVVEEAGPGGRVLAAIDIAAPVRVVWRVMLDCERAPFYVPGLRSCAIIESAADGRSDVREHEIRWLALMPTLRLRFRSAYEPERAIRVARIGGDLAAMEGAWILETRENGRVTRLHYDFHIAPRTPFPAGLVRAGMLRDAPEVLEAVRAEAMRIAAQ